MAVKIWNLVPAHVRIYTPDCLSAALFFRDPSPVQVIQFRGKALRPILVDRQGKCVHLEVESQSLGRL